VIDSNPGPVLSQIDRLLQQGKPGEAASLCLNLLATSPGDPSAIHLLGLARARLRQPQEAERLLRRSIELVPFNIEFQVNFANFLRRSGRLSEAEATYRAALRAAPHSRKARHNLALTVAGLGRNAEAESECRSLLSEDDRDAEAWSLLAFVLTNQSRLFEAEVAYRRSLDLTPNYGLAHHNLGSVLVQLDRAEEAIAALERAGSLGTPDFELSFTRGRAMTLLYRLDEAEHEYSKAVAARPGHLEAHMNLARLRFMRGDPHFTRGLVGAIGAAPNDLQLQALLCTLLFSTGRYELAEARIRDVMAANGPLPLFRILLAQVLLEVGRLKEAETEALEAAAAQPRNSQIVDTLVSILLSRGRAEDALPFIQSQRSLEPDRQNWLAHEATAARLLGRPAYQDLFDYARFVRKYRPELPRGWSSMVELKAAVLEALKARHRFVSHPFDQSLRHGSQTTRNLVVDPDDAIQALMRSFEEPLQTYLRDIGSETAHPFTARNRRQAHISEGWSVQLRRSGFHVNHLHPKGWISSAYYVSVPEEVSDVTLKSGWLKFGEPRYEVPGAAADCFVQPENALLVLFPSYMWHGTNAIHGPELRTTIAFDAVPTPKSGR
jgi:Flp pilus assembly protein TadD